MKFRLRLFFVVLLCFAVAFASSFSAPAYADKITEKVYLGGFPIGISLDIDGLLVEEVTGVETEYGLAVVDGIEKGDVIKKINGYAVRSADDILSLITTDVTDVEIYRNGENIEISVTPLIECYTDKPRLGVKVKDKTYGIGTVTLVKKDGTYAALGHEMECCEGSAHFSGGKIGACKILGVKQGENGKAGSILASIVADTDYGTVERNTKFGLSGKYERDVSDLEEIRLADRSEVLPGKAYIRTTVDKSPEYYEIEIIKATHKNSKSEKSIVFRVTDKKLLKISGGVVRGMSGSPIIQNGKLCGSVTHVFLNDFTKGYGVYADSLACF